jgi:hypothetical protein
MVRSLPFGFILLAAPTLGRGPLTGADAGNSIVVLFGLLIWAPWLLSLFARESVESPPTCLEGRHKRGRQAKPAPTNG